MKKEDFEHLLDVTVAQLSKESRAKPFTSSKQFENRVREVFIAASENKVSLNFDPHPLVFPDIAVGEFGIEVKFTTKDTWRSVANSVLESTRNAEVKHIYLLFGKMGGKPEVRWDVYEQCVMHVRTSHVPRFEVEMNGKESLFDKMGVAYDVFSGYSLEEKMQHIRKYARGRLAKGERLWWLEDDPDQMHTLPMSVRIYMTLPQPEKRRLRAEAALLCPKVVQTSRTKDKYYDAVLYLLTYRGVLCPQARDLFSAGSVAQRVSENFDGNYVARALHDIESEMRQAANELEDALFAEY